MQRGRHLSRFYTSVSGERKSKRARKGRAPVPASSRHTLWDLKLRILEALDVHPRNAAVHAWRSGSWQALGPDEATLAGVGPFPVRGDGISAAGAWAPLRSAGSKCVVCVCLLGIRDAMLLGKRCMTHTLAAFGIPLLLRYHACSSLM